MKSTTPPRSAHGTEPRVHVDHPATAPIRLVPEGSTWQRPQQVGGDTVLHRRPQRGAFEEGRLAPRAIPGVEASAASSVEGLAACQEVDAAAGGATPTSEAASTATSREMRTALGELPQVVSAEQGGGAPLAGSHTTPQATVIDIPEPAPIEIIAAELRKRPFDAEGWEPGARKDIELGRQREMESEYIQSMSRVLAARQAAFGGDGLYHVAVGMKAPVQQAVLPAMYEAARQFVSSSARSPARNALVARLGPHTEPDGRSVGELAYQMDTATVAGAISGVCAYVTESWLLQALARRAALANFPELKAVDPKVLVPDPSPVQLRLVGPDLAKVYWRPSERRPARGAERDQPTMTELRNEALRRRSALSTWQKRLDGQGLLRWFQPGMSGAFNVVRRAVSSESALISPGPVFLASVLASSSAGAVSKFTLTLAKTLPGLAQAEVDDLVGGRQTMNLFAVKVPDAGMPTPGWRDVRHLPGFLADVGREAASLAAVSFRPSAADRGAQTLDLVRTSLANATASVVSQAVGPLLGSVMRGGAITPSAGESLRSGAYLLQQFGQSTMNDYEWNSSKDYTGSDAHALASELDRVRDRKQADLLRCADRAGTQVLAETRVLLGGVPLGDAAVAALWDLHTLLSAGTDDQIDLQRLAAARHRLERAVAGDGVPGIQAETYGRVVAGIDLAIALNRQHDRLAKWRSPGASAS